MKPQIFVVGRPTQDIFITCSDLQTDQRQTTISLPLGAKLACQTVVAVGGNAANVAVSLTRAGLKPKLIGQLGNDEIGRQAQNRLNNKGIDIRGLTLVDGQPTGLSVILLTGEGERTILNHQGPKIELKDCQQQMAAIKPGDWVYLSSIGTSQELAEIIVWVADRGGQVAINPTPQALEQPQPLLDVIDRLKLLIANREETACLFAGQTLAELAAAASQKIPLVVVTDGPKGSVAATAGQLYRAGLYPTPGPVIDRTGAGDAFAGGFLAGLVLGHPIPDCLTWAAANSASVVSHLGAEAGIVALGTQDLKPLAIDQTPLH